MTPLSAVGIVSYITLEGGMQYEEIRTFFHFIPAKGYLSH